MKLKTFLKKASAVICALGCLMAVAPAAVSAATGGSDPAIQISTCQQLQAIDNDLKADYVLIKDIDCSATKDWNGGAGFSPIGFAKGGTAFTGTFDGQGHTITGLTVNRGGTDNTGLFYQIDDSTIRSIGFQDADIAGNNSDGVLAGLIVDSNVTGIQAENSSVTSAGDGVGGLVGDLVGNFGDFALTGSWFSGNVTGRNDTGGLAGYVSFVNITDSYSTGKVSGGGNVGGLVGEFQDFWSISNTYSHSNVTASGNVAGGLVGQLGDGVHGAPGINASYASGNVTSSADTVGGFVGSDIAAIDNSFAGGAVSAPHATDAGGFVGTYTAGDSNDNFYDRIRTGQSSCAGGGSCSSVMPGVTTIDTNSSPNSSYFFNSLSNAPMSSWDTSLWVSKDGAFPVLHRKPNGVNSMAASPGSTYLKVSWKAPDASDTPDITGYTLKYRPSDLSAGWRSVSLPAADNGYAITGLNSNTDYQVAVFVTDEDGASGGLSRVYRTSPAPVITATNTVTSSASTIGFFTGPSGAAKATAMGASESDNQSTVPSPATTAQKPVAKPGGQYKYWFWSGALFIAFVGTAGFIRLRPRWPV